MYGVAEVIQNDVQINSAAQYLHNRLISLHLGKCNLVLAGVTFN